MGCVMASGGVRMRPWCLCCFWILGHEISVVCWDQLLHLCFTLDST